MSDLTDTIDTYLAAWSEQDDAARAELVGPDGTVALKGLDVGEVGDDGRLRRITGFFGELEAA